MNHPAGTPVPPDLPQFQRTSRAPDGGSAVRLLAEHDDYVNGGGPTPTATHRAEPIREVAGWRLTADVSIPAG